MAGYKQNLEILQKKAKERTVRTQTIEYDLETLVKKIEKNVIKLNPDYQRHHRWSDDISSRLIESLILNIPVPIIYISQDIDVDEETDEDFARYSVIDGQQRLTAVFNFFSNRYALTGLDILQELNGALYRDLPPFLVRRLEERHIRCLRIDSTVDTQLKYDIFERLNSGAVKLEPQELRNATCRGPFRDLTKKLVQNRDFRAVANITPIRHEKMEDQELILRFFAVAYRDGYEDYKGGFKDFLTEKMRTFNGFSDAQLKEMENLFATVMQAARKKFGDTPYAKYRYMQDTDHYKRMSKFNAAVYDTVNVAFVEAIVNEQEIACSHADFQKLFRDDKFFAATEGSVNDVAKLRDRILLGSEVIK